MVARNSCVKTPVRIKVFLEITACFFVGTIDFPKLNSEKLHERLCMIRICKIDSSETCFQKCLEQSCW
jgi:hypothetical protein